MKINTKKSVIFTAAAVMILIAALLIGCSSPGDGSFGEEDPPTAPGTGRAKLSINTRKASRTILPASLPTPQYWVTFSDSTPVALPSYSGSITTAGSGTLSNIPVGTYNGISVIVCTDATSSTTAASTAYAKGSASGSYVITDGGTTTVTTPISTTLYTVAEGKTNSGTGTFAYTFDLTGISSTLFSSASFEIKERGGSTFGSPTRPLTRSANTGTVTSIPAGYYDVIVTLTDSRSTPNHAYLYQILHVYQNMTSSFSYSGFSDTLFPATAVTGSGSLTISNPSLPSDVTYTLSSTGPNASNGVVSGTSTTSYMVTISKSAAADPTLTVTITPATGLSIVGWFYIASGTKTAVPGTVVAGGGNTVNLSINTASAPFNQKIDIVTTVEFDLNGEPLAAVPVTIRINN